jgi:hypothetical protein
MGRTIPSWRIVVENEIVRLKKFQESLRIDDREIFDDLLKQCKLYASAASAMASPVKEVPLIVSLLFAHHKMILELEKQIREGKNSPALKNTD